MDRNTILFLVVGLLVGIGIGFLFFSGVLSFQANQKAITNKVLETYELANPNTNLEVMNVKERGGLYEVILSTGQQTHQTVYVTKDGKFLSEVLLNLSQFKETMQSRKEFFNCLKDKDVKIYGALQTNNTQIQRATRLQIQLLGGANYLGDIYQDCSNNLQACVQQGVKTLPSVKYGGKFYGGVKQYQWFQNVTDCSLG